VPAPPPERSTSGDRLGGAYLRVLGSSTLANIGDGIGTIAAPWLASAITRNPALIALVAVAQRLGWLVFSLPAGVLTDRVDRRRAIVAMDSSRAVITGVLALVVLANQTALPGPELLARGLPDTGTNLGLFILVIGATVLLGAAEVVRDNAAQTILPAVVPASRLEDANGRLWSLESVANTFVGPPLGSVLLAVAFALPFAVHAGTFAAAAVLMATLAGTYRAPQPANGHGSWRSDLAEGVRWLWSHELLRPMAIILGVLNLAMMLTTATFVLFAQEILGVGPLLFAIVGFGGAVGSIIGGLVASRLTAAIGPGACLALTLGGGALADALIGLSSQWYLVLGFFAIVSFLGIVWNVITVSLRQTIVPAEMLGRVNSVYRFFAWGMMPIGAALGGVVVVVVEQFASRELALRATWFVSAAIQIVLFAVGRRLLSTEAIERARSV